MSMRKKKLYLAGIAGITIPLRVYKPLIVKYSIVYYIKLRFADGLVLYKIGYTSMTIVERVEGYYDRRTRSYKYGMGLPSGCTYRIISVVYKGSKESAYEREQALHNLHQAYRWNGPNRCRNGNTEMYTRDVLGLDMG